MKGGRGITIGAYTSQLIGNWILAELDHYMKEVVGVNCYIRYCDDVVGMCETKEEAKRQVNEYVRLSNELGLCVKADIIVAPIEKRRIDFLGYTYGVNGSGVRLRKRTKKKLARALKRVKNRERKSQLLASYKGWCKHGDCRNLWYRLTGEKIMGFKSKGVRRSNRTQDGQKFFDVPSVRIADILNLPITVLDFEEGVKTKQGEGRCCVLIEIKGERKKFISNSYAIKDILNEAMRIESEEDREVFPVSGVVIRRKSLSDGKSAYEFEDVDVD